MIVTNDKRSIRLRWLPVLAATHYSVDVFDNRDPANPLPIATNLLATNPRFEWTPADFEKHNHPPIRDLLFRVYSVNRLGVPSSDYAEVGVHNPPPASPPPFRIFQSLGRIQVEFTEPITDDYLQYIIWASTTPGFQVSEETVVYRGHQSSVVFAQTPYDTTFYYRVGIRDLWGDDSDAAVSPEYSIHSLPPGEEYGKRAGISVVWSEVAGAASYDVKAYDNTDPAAPVQVWAGNVTEPYLNYTPGHLDALGVERFRDFKVEATPLDGNGIPIGPMQVVTYTEPAPPIPGFVLDSSPGTITVTFDPPAADVAGYRIWASTQSGFTPDAATLVFDGSGESVTFTNLDPGVTWYFRVAAWDHWGKKNLNVSGEHTVTVSGSDAYLLDPGSLVDPYNSVELTWLAATGPVDHYDVKIYDNTDPAAPVLVMTRTARVTRTVVTPSDIKATGHSLFRAIRYDVTPVFTNGMPGTTASYTASNPAPTAPSVSLTGAPGALTVNISSSGDATGYKIWASTTSGFTPDATTLVYDGASPSVTFSGLTPGVTWYYRVAAYDIWGDKGLNITPEFTITVPGAEDYLLNPATGRANLGLGSAATVDGVGSTTFTTADGKTVTVTNGVITSVV